MASRRSPTKSSSTIARASANAGAATLLPRSPFSSKSPAGVPRGDSSPSKNTNLTVCRGRLIVRASWAATAVPDAPSLAPTKPGMSLVS